MSNDIQIPIERIISVACRNFMAFDDLHTFKFDEGINTVVGGNSSGKSSLVTLISRALQSDMTKSRRGNWHRDFFNDEALIEMKFIAGGREHYLRRVLISGTTSDLHLYIEEEGGGRTFYRDGQVIDYFNKLKKITTANDFENPRRDFYFWTSGKTTNVNPLFAKSKETIRQINTFLPVPGGNIAKLHLIDNDVMALDRVGELRNLSFISGGEAKMIFLIAKIITVINDVEKEDSSRVILIDEIETGLDKSRINALYETMKSIGEEFGCQFIVTSRFANGRANPIRVNSIKIPDCYSRNDLTNGMKAIQNYIKKFNSNFVFKKPAMKINRSTFKW